MRYFVRSVRGARWSGSTPVTDKMREDARGDFALRTKDQEDGLSICEVDSPRDEDHHLFVAATATDRPFTHGGTKLDDSSVDVLVITDDDLKGLGGTIDSKSESCIIEIRTKHRALNWQQETLDTLVELLLQGGREAKRFSRSEIRQILLGLQKEQFSDNATWTYVQAHRTEWEKQASKLVPQQKREGAGRERQGSRNRKEPSAMAPVVPIPDPSEGDAGAPFRESPASPSDSSPAHSSTELGPERPAAPPDRPAPRTDRSGATRRAAGYVAIAVAIIVIIAWALFMLTSSRV